MAHILVVDDDEDVLTSVRDMLVHDGHETMIVSKAAEALRQIAVNKPDGVIIDVIMPEMNGIDLCKRLRRDFSPDEMTIIILSAVGQEVDVEMGMAAGADGYLVKPFGILSVTAMLDDLLAKRGAF